MAVGRLTVCVTGGTGFVGSSLVRALERDRRFRLRVLTRRASPLPDHSAIEVVNGDLLDPVSLESFLEKEALVVHLAYSRDGHPGRNIRAARELARACAKSRIARFVHLSTAVVAGAARAPIVDEETVCEPADEYESTKLEIEEILRAELRGRCPLVVLRPTAVFGPGGQNLLKTSADLAADSPWKRYVRLSLLRRRRLNLVSVQNVVAAILFAMEAESQSEDACYIVSDDDAPLNTYAGVSSFLARELGLSECALPPLPLLWRLLPLALRIRGKKGIDPERIYSAGKLLKSGFRPPMEFETALHEFATWYKGART